MNNTSKSAEMFLENYESEKKINLETDDRVKLLKALSSFFNKSNGIKPCEYLMNNLLKVVKKN